MVEDMNKEGFNVSDKYKAKYEELGKIACAKPLIYFFPSLLGSSFFSFPLITIPDFDYYWRNLTNNRLLHHQARLMKND
jgi:hypothetical protein